MTDKKVFVTRIIVPDAIARLKENFDVEVWEEPTPPPKDLVIPVSNTHLTLPTILLV